MKVVVSYALFGENNRYAQYLPAVVRAHRVIYSGFTMRLHHDQHLSSGPYGKVIRVLEASGQLETRLMSSEGEIPRCKAMLWRMAPLFDPSVGVVFCRDLDSLPLPRDRAAMDDFVSSEARIHCLWDNPYHGGIMGGMSGWKRPAPFGVTSLDEIYGFGGGVDWSKHGSDQDVLNKLFGNTAPMLSVRSPYRMGGNLPPDLYPSADKLAPHIGAPGFDIDRAVAFYNEHGGDVVKEVIARAEKFVGAVS